MNNMRHRTNAAGDWAPDDVLLHRKTKSIEIIDFILGGDVYIKDTMIKEFDENFGHSKEVWESMGWENIDANYRLGGIKL